MLIKRIAAALLVGGGLTLAAPAHAAQIVTFQFTGVVSELTSDHGLFGAPGTVNVGDPFSGHFSYLVGPGNPDQLPAEPSIGVYDLLDFVVDGGVATFSGLSLVLVSRTPPAPALPPAPPDPGADTVSVFTQSPNYAAGVRLRLTAPFGAALADDSLPLALNLADFSLESTLTGSQGETLFQQPPSLDVGRLTSLTRAVGVAEPPPLALVAAGALILVMLLARAQAPSRPQREAVRGH